MIISLGINTVALKYLLFPYPMLYSFVRRILAQYQGFSDINMGTGTMIMGLASIIIGFSIFRNFNFQILVFYVYLVL